MAKEAEYEIQLKYITRRHVEADSPDDALESISLEEVDDGELSLFQIDVIDEDGQVVSQGHYNL